MREEVKDDGSGGAEASSRGIRVRDIADYDHLRQTLYVALGTALKQVVQSSSAGDREIDSACLDVMGLLFRRLAVEPPMVRISLAEALGQVRLGIEHLFDVHGKELADGDVVERRHQLEVAVEDLLEREMEEVCDISFCVPCPSP
jgi:hypothetical protein